MFGYVLKVEIAVMGDTQVFCRCSKITASLQEELCFRLNGSVGGGGCKSTFGSVVCVGESL